MSIERGGPSEEELQAKRAVSDAEHIEDGAKYEKTKDGRLELRFTGTQVEKERAGMEAKPRALAAAEEIIKKIRPEDLQPGGNLKFIGQDLHTAAELYQQAGETEKARELFGIFAADYARRFEEAEPDMRRYLSREWLMYAELVGDPAALQVAKKRIDEVLKSDK